MSATPRAIVALAFLLAVAGCTVEGGSHVAAVVSRSESLDIAVGGEPLPIAVDEDDPDRPWRMKGWCTTDSQCVPSLSGASPCVEVRCRKFAYASDTYGRCFVRASERPDLTTCTVLGVGSLYANIADAVEGISLGLSAMPAAIATDVASSSNLGNGCLLDDDCDSGYCVDGRCCQTACAGGPTDCVACSEQAGGAKDGLCTPILRPQPCTHPSACVPHDETGATCGLMRDDARYAGACAPRTVLAVGVGGEQCCTEATTCFGYDEARVSSAGEVDCKNPMCPHGFGPTSFVCSPGPADCCMTNDACGPVNPCTVAATCELPRGRCRYSVPEIEPAECGMVVDAGGDSNVGPADAEADADAVEDASDAEVIVDAGPDLVWVPLDSAVADATPDAPAPREPVFRGGGGISCAASSGGANETAAEALWLLTAVMFLVRRKRA